MKSTRWVKCQCGSTHIRNVPITRWERIVRWFKRWKDPMVKYTMPDEQVKCVKCGIRRRELEKRNYNG